MNLCWLIGKFIFGVFSNVTYLTEHKQREIRTCYRYGLCIFNRFSVPTPQL